MRKCRKKPKQKIWKLRSHSRRLVNDLKQLSGRKLPSPYEGKVKKIKSKLEWQYVEPQPPILAAYGYRWKRDLVVWNRKQGRPRKGNSVKKELWGENARGRKVNFGEQVGIYLLHDGRRTVYVGRIQKAKSGKRGLYDRLFEHTKDTLKDDWEKFSWFGFLQVNEDGTLSKNHVSRAKDDKDKELEELITTIEAVIICGMKPGLNNRGGDMGGTVKYEQWSDPEAENTSAR